MAKCTKHSISSYGMDKVVRRPLGICEAERGNKVNSNFYFFVFKE